MAGSTATVLGKPPTNGRLPTPSPVVLTIRLLSTSVMAVWLIAKGFNPRAVVAETSGETAPAIETSLAGAGAL